jgi:F-type H+-transporting ATPase subunit c
MNRFDLARATIAVLPLLLVANTAMAQDMSYKSGVGMGAGLAIGLAAMGCGVGQGLASKAALDGIARNPNASSKIQTPFILGLALIESLAIYGLVIAYFLQGKV